MGMGRAHCAMSSKDKNMDEVTKRQPVMPMRAKDIKSTVRHCFATFSNERLYTCSAPSNKRFHAQIKTVVPHTKPFRAQEHYCTAWV